MFLHSTGQSANMDMWNEVRLSTRSLQAIKKPPFRTAEIRGPLRPWIRRVDSGSREPKNLMPSLLPSRRKEGVMVPMDDFQAPPGYRVVYCLCFKHWRSGQLVYRKNGGYFRFLVRA